MIWDPTEDRYEENLRVIVAFVRKCKVRGIVIKGADVGAHLTYGEWARVQEAASELFEELRGT